MVRTSDGVEQGVNDLLGELNRTREYASDKLLALYGVELELTLFFW